MASLSLSAAPARRGNPPAAAVPAASPTRPGLSAQELVTPFATREGVAVGDEDPGENETASLPVGRLRLEHGPATVVEETFEGKFGGFHRTDQRKREEEADKIDDDDDDDDEEEEEEEEEEKKEKEVAEAPIEDRAIIFTLPKDDKGEALDRLETQPPPANAEPHTDQATQPPSASEKPLGPSPGDSDEKRPPTGGSRRRRWLLLLALVSLVGAAVALGVHRGSGEDGDDARGGDDGTTIGEDGRGEDQSVAIVGENDAEDRTAAPAAPSAHGPTDSPPSSLPSRERAPSTSFSPSALPTEQLPLTGSPTAPPLLPPPESVTWVANPVSTTKVATPPPYAPSSFPSERSRSPRPIANGPTMQPRLPPTEFSNPTLPPTKNPKQQPKMIPSQESLQSLSHQPSTSFPSSSPTEML